MKAVDRGIYTSPEELETQKMSGFAFGLTEEGRFLACRYEQGEMVWEEEYSYAQVISIYENLGLMIEEMRAKHTS